MIDDNPDDVALLLRGLSSSFDVTAERVDTESGMRDALAQEWDLVLVDWVMPRFSAPDALRVLEQCGRMLPCIVVSGCADEQIAVAAVRGGARDFIRKGEVARLLAAIGRELDPR